MKEIYGIISGMDDDNSKYEKIKAAYFGEGGERDVVNLEEK